MRISKETQETVTFIASIIQPLVIVLGGLWAIFTFLAQQESEIEAARRELQRPYYEKQLALYLDASRVVAHLARRPTGPEKEALEARYWELYWGELAFVESPEVERLMVSFCKEYFGDELECHSGPEGAEDLPKVAIDLARQTSGEVRGRWTDLGD
jgi:hypothetical protein